MRAASELDNFAAMAFRFGQHFPRVVIGGHANVPGHAEHIDFIAAAQRDDNIVSDRCRNWHLIDPNDMGHSCVSPSFPDINVGQSWTSRKGTWIVNIHLTNDLHLCAHNDSGTLADASERALALDGSL